MIILEEGKPWWNKKIICKYCQTSFMIDKEDFNEKIKSKTVRAAEGYKTVIEFKCPICFEILNMCKD